MFVSLFGVSLKTGMTVKFGATSATSVSCSDQTVCGTVNPPHAAGKVNLTVTVNGIFAVTGATCKIRVSD
jgi:hypothetical protein